MKGFIHFTQPLFGEEEKKEILSVLDSGWVTLGPRTKKFEDDFAKYVGAKHAVAVSSCTAGLHLSLIAAGIGPGDEVITTPFTFVATSNTIVQVGAKPVFVDIEENTFNIDPSKIEKNITSKTKAIVPVHYGGLSARLDDIIAIAKKYKLVVIEDAAHATGAYYKGRKIGTFGDLTNFSFHPVKNMSTGDGGIITTHNDEYADKLRMLRLHGMSRDAWKRHTASGTWKYDVEMPGFKYNMTDVAAALGIHQLAKLDSFIKMRKEYARIYDEAFLDVPEIEIPYIPDNEEHIYSLYTIKVNTENLKATRDQIVEELKKLNIGTSVYFIPLHYFTYYKNTYGYHEGDFPVAEKVFEQIISLPLYPRMNLTQVKFVIKTLLRIISESRKEYTWIKDEFDTDIFGMNVAKVKQIYANGDKKTIHKILSKLQKDLDKNKIKYTTYRVDANKFSLIQALEEKGFKLVDGLISFKSDLNGISYSIDSHIREAKNDDLEDLKRLASSVFYLNRVYNDEFLDKKKADKLYAKWIENSILKKAADKILLWEENNKILGFITIQKNGHLPLLGVTEEARGKGIAKALVKAALKTIKEWGGKESEIETQMANIPALRAYSSCGFKITDSHLTFRWVNNGL